MSEAGKCMPSRLSASVRVNSKHAIVGIQRRVRRDRLTSEEIFRCSRIEELGFNTSIHLGVESIEHHPMEIRYFGHNTNNLKKDQFSIANEYDSCRTYHVIDRGQRRACRNLSLSLVT